MTVRRPGFIDEGGGREVQPEAAPLLHEESLSSAIAGTAGPIMLELPEDARTGRVDQAWTPEIIKSIPAKASSLSWLAAGLAVMLFGWVGLSATAFVHDQFRRSPELGAATLVVFVAAISIVLRGLLMEVKAYRVLRRVDVLRINLARSDLSLADAKRLCRSWLMVVADRLPNAEGALKTLEATESVAELKAILRSRAIAPLDQVARQISRIGAMQGGALVAVVPSPALDGVFSGLRGLALVRQVAQLYGLRPGIAVTLSLFRRVAWTAAGVSGVDLLAQSAADHFLHGLPIFKHLAGAVPGTSIAALRLYRLGIITSKACSPLEDD